MIEATVKPYSDTNRIMRGVSIAVAIALSLLVSAKKGNVDFIAGMQFNYGMSLAEADKRLAEGKEDWFLAYRVDTPSTNQFAAVYRESDFYLVRFYEGSCYYIERRAELQGEDVAPLFEYYGEQFGETPEATQSHDQRLWYAHWMLKDRDVELTAYQREGNVYVVTYEEFDPLRLGEALRIQEEEVGNAPVEIDPLTGKPRPLEHSVEGEASGEGQQEGAQDGEAAEGDEEGAEEPPPEDDEEEDWDWY